MSLRYLQQEVRDTTARCAAGRGPVQIIYDPHEWRAYTGMPPGSYQGVCLKRKGREHAYVWGRHPRIRNPLVPGQQRRVAAHEYGEFDDCPLRRHHTLERLVRGMRRPIETHADMVAPIMEFVHDVHLMPRHFKRHNAGRAFLTGKPGRAPADTAAEYRRIAMQRTLLQAVAEGLLENPYVVEGETIRQVKTAADLHQANRLASERMSGYFVQVEEYYDKAEDGTAQAGPQEIMIQDELVQVLVILGLEHETAVRIVNLAMESVRKTPPQSHRSTQPITPTGMTNYSHPNSTASPTYGQRPYGIHTTGRGTPPRMAEGEKCIPRNPFSKVRTAFPRGQASQVAGRGSGLPDGKPQIIAGKATRVLNLYDSHRFTISAPV